MKLVPFSSGEPTPWDFDCMELWGLFLLWEHSPAPEQQAASKHNSAGGWRGAAFTESLEWCLYQGNKEGIMLRYLENECFKNLTDNC